MNKQAIRNRLYSASEGSPHFVAGFAWNEEPKVSTLYSPWRDSRFGPECFDETGKRLNETGIKLAHSLQIKGISSMLIDEAERIIEDSKQFYKN